MSKSTAPDFLNDFLELAENEIAKHLG
jgi:hypothetical protein